MSPGHGLSVPGTTMLMSRGHFRHPPVSGDAGLAGMPDITDVCGALIDSGLSQRPATGNTRSR